MFVRNYVDIADSIGLNPYYFKELDNTIYTICELNIMSELVSLHLEDKMVYISSSECFEVLAKNARVISEESLILGKYMSEYENTSNACKEILHMFKDEASESDVRLYEDKMAKLAIRLARDSRFTELCLAVELDIKKIKSENIDTSKTNKLDF